MTEDEMAGWDHRLNGHDPCVVWKGFPAFPAHLRMRPASRGNWRRATWGAGVLILTLPARWGGVGCVACWPTKKRKQGL